MQLMIEETSCKENSSSGFDYLCHKWHELGREKEDNLFSNIFYAMDAIFI
jgi:hypothetical protein